MQIKKTIIASAAFIALLAASAAQAASSTDAFYRPMNWRDLGAKLPPRMDQDRTLEQADVGSFLDGSGGCPDDISIGSIPEDATVYGNVEIEVVIQEDIYIKCGGL